MLGLGFGLLFVGILLITWGAAEVAREAGAGPPGGCALIVLWVLSAQTKAGKIGWILILLGWLMLMLMGAMYS